MKKFRISVNNKVFEVEVEEIKEGATTHSKEPVIEITKPGVKIEKPAVKEAPSPVDLSGEKITAPLPGTVSVEVSEGNTVAKGDVLFILEAMKMENEITAPLSGTVKAIFFNSGDAVDTGDTLAIIE